jgi:hypothetical protein
MTVSEDASHTSKARIIREPGLLRKHFGFAGTRTSEGRRPGDPISDRVSPDYSYEEFAHFR